MRDWDGGEMGTGLKTMHNANSLLVGGVVDYVAGNARTNREGVVSRSVVYFTHHVPQLSINSPEPLKLRKILDMVTLQYPLSAVVGDDDVFIGGMKCRDC